MFKVLKNLKKTWLSVVIIVILLCVQAWADLELPSYTSKIVNIGIQQGGIENVSPVIIRKSQLENLLIFTSDDEKILDSYELNTKDLSYKLNKKINKYFGKNNNVELETVYVLKDLNEQEQQDLNEIMAKPLMEVYSLTNETLAMQMKESILQNVPEEQKVSLENMDLISILKSMPEKQLNQMLDDLSNTIDKKMGTMISQVAINATKEEYIKLGINTDNIQNNYIFMAGLQMLIIAAISMVTAVSIMLLSSRVAANLGKTLREKVFKKVLGFSTEEFTNFSTASLITRSTNDIQQIQMLISMLFRVVVYAPIMGIGGFFKVLATSNNSMAWIIGVAIGSILLIVMILFAIAMPKFKKLQDLIDKLNLVSREMLTGIPVIRAFHTEKREEARFEQANQNLMKNYMFVNNAMNLMMPILMLIMNGISLLTIWAGAHSVDTGNMQVGDIMAFLQYTMQIVMAFLMISMISIMLPRAGVSAKRINEVLEKKNRIKDPKEPKHFDENKKGLVEFENVSFRYPDADEDLLTNITFTAKPRRNYSYYRKYRKWKIYNC